MVEINPYPPPISIPPGRPSESSSEPEPPKFQIGVETSPTGHRAPRVTFELGSAGWWAALFAGLASAAITLAGWWSDHHPAVAPTQDYGSQVSKLEERVSACETKRTALENRVRKGENWNAAVFSQALGVDVHRSDNSEPLPALRITVPLRKPNRLDPHAPIVIVDTVQPTSGEEK